MTGVKGEMIFLLFQNTMAISEVAELFQVVVTRFYFYQKVLRDNDINFEGFPV